MNSWQVEISGSERQETLQTGENEQFCQNLANRSLPNFANSNSICHRLSYRVILDSDFRKELIVYSARMWAQVIHGLGLVLTLRMGTDFPALTQRARMARNVDKARPSS